MQYTVISNISPQTFVGHMYGRCPKTSLVNINSTRYFADSKKGEMISCDVLPPWPNVLSKPIDRSNYQSKIWRKATI